ncbi:hypothetical protein IEQ34_021024 [Dendrobium chrysotoxum]|uniref:CGL160/ATPI domain-containing protein n=1 Tax=Dendrobium chrysotoxum TaxID=161865 RepID=A0AAV7G4D2_DENCH|nr:hypothetical protein IEQ34_021024 [Dendrobium chrysotoxum]
MAVLTTLTSILAVRSAANPATGGDADSSLTQLPSPRLTRVILPKKKPLKWSTGTAPGEYGGPPTTTKLRKYWGGGDGDPVTSTDDFIWNKDFVGHMKRFLRDEPNASSTFPSRVVEQSSGFLSLKRAMSLDSVGIDLSEELRPPPKPVLEQQVEAARSGRSAADNLDDAASPRWRLVPTRREQAKWDRANKAATGGSDVIIRESSRSRGDPRVLAAQSSEDYFKLKKNLQVLTLGIGGIGVISAYVSYSPEIAASFGAGLVGSLIYIRMLGNTIDSMAAGAKGLVNLFPAFILILSSFSLILFWFCSPRTNCLSALQVSSNLAFFKACSFIYDLMCIIPNERRTNANKKSAKSKAISSIFNIFRLYLG